MNILSKNRYIENGKTIKEYKLFNQLVLRKETSKNTMPFLVDQKEDLDSILWNGNNTIYNELIEALKQRLTDKLSAYYLKEIYKELFKNKGENI